MLRALVFLSILAIVSLTSMPFGYMPDRAENGAFVLRICDGTMPMDHGAAGEASAMAMHADGHAPGDSPDAASDHETRCNYAVAAVASLPDGPVVPESMPVPAMEVPDLPDTLTGIFPASLPPSTGPPPTV